MSPIELDDDDAALEALLASDPAPEDGEAFTAAVMRRVRSEASTLDAAAALAELRRRRSASPHTRRWSVFGAGAGTLLALGGALWPVPIGSALDGPQTLALLAAGAIAAWALAAPALQDKN